MSDTQYSTVAAKFRRLDKVDDDWMKDMLSDDGRPDIQLHIQTFCDILFMQK